MDKQKRNQPTQVKIKLKHRAKTRRGGGGRRGRAIQMEVIISHTANSSPYMK